MLNKNIFLFPYYSNRYLVIGIIVITIFWHGHSFSIKINTFVKKIQYLCSYKQYLEYIFKNVYIFGKVGLGAVIFEPMKISAVFGTFQYLIHFQPKLDIQYLNSKPSIAASQHSPNWAAMV